MDTNVLCVKATFLSFFAIFFFAALPIYCLAVPEAPSVTERFSEKANAAKQHNIEYYEGLRDKALAEHFDLLSKAEDSPELREEATLLGGDAVYFALNAYWLEWRTVPLTLTELVTDGYISRMPINPYTGEEMKSVSPAVFSPGDLVYQFEPAGLWEKSCDCPIFYWLIDDFVLTVYGEQRDYPLDNPEAVEDLAPLEWVLTPEGSIEVWYTVTAT